MRGDRLQLHHLRLLQLVGGAQEAVRVHEGAERAGGGGEEEPLLPRQRVQRAQPRLDHLRLQGREQGWFLIG